jgi:low affinity Fe/Cu permease
MNHSKARHNGRAAPNPVSAKFSHFAQQTAIWTGHPAAFLLALLVIVVWIVTGPVFNYSDTWQLVINTGTTIVTFLMVFLIQNTQNRDMLAVQIKLSELVLAMKGAENSFAAIEDLTDEELQTLHEECRARAEMTGQHIEHRRSAKPTNNARSDSAEHQAGTSRRKSQRQAAKS